jgi:crossover junction endodeoxyribonuclease RuvC
MTYKTFGPTSILTRVSSKPVKSLLVLGIDPGSRSTGWGILERRGFSIKVVGFGSLKPPRAAGRPAALAFLADKLELLLGENAIDVVAIETPFSAKFPRSALALAEARGALLATLGRWGGKVLEYEPARVKSLVVGQGRAEKRQVSFVIRHELGIAELTDDDAADALALAWCHLRTSPP